MITTASQLQDTLHTHIPISRHMGIEVSAFDGTTLTLTAPLDANVNVHGTGFAGSIYAVGALAGWSMMTLQLGLHNLAGSLVIANANVTYHKPVDGPIVARCDVLGDTFAPSMQRLQERGRARFALHTCIGDPADPQASLAGEYAVRLAALER